MNIPNIFRIPLAVVLRKLHVNIGYQWMQRIGTPSIVTVRLDHAHSFKMHGTGLSLENRLYWRGFTKGHEPMTAKTFAQLVAKANWVIDVGANAGFYALMAQAINAKVQVAAFEPHPFFYNLLTQNAALNNFPIQIINEAASNNAGKVKFYFPKPNQGNVYSGSVSMHHFQHHQNTQPEIVEVVTNPLDPFITTKGWKNGGIIKIDAEGHDEEVLLGLHETIKRYAPIIIIEIQSLEKAESIAKQPFMQNYSYQGMHDKLGFIIDSLLIPYYAGCDNYICIPQVH